MAKEPPPKKMKLEGPKDEETNPNEPKTEEVMRAAGFIPRVLAWPWAKAEAAEHAVSSSSAPFCSLPRLTPEMGSGPGFAHGSLAAQAFKAVMASQREEGGAQG